MTPSPAAVFHNCRLPDMDGTRGVWPVSTCHQSGKTAAIIMPEIAPDAEYRCRVKVFGVLQAGKFIGAPAPVFIVAPVSCMGLVPHAAPLSRPDHHRTAWKFGALCSSECRMLDTIRRHFFRAIYPPPLPWKFFWGWRYPLFRFLPCIPGGEITPAGRKMCPATTACRWMD